MESCTFDPDPRDIVCVRQLASIVLICLSSKLPLQKRRVKDVLPTRAITRETMGLLSMG
jgi:hypothetical protein